MDNVDAKLPSVKRERRTGNEVRSLKRDHVPRTGKPSPKAASEPAAAGGLQFINLLGTTEHDTEGRNTVRAQARRHAWKNKKDEQAAAGNSGSASRKSVPRKPRKPAVTATSVDAKKEPSSSRIAAANNHVVETPASPESPTNLSKTTYHGVFAELPPEVARYTVMALAAMENNALSPLRMENGHADPFHAYPIQLTPKMHHLMHYARGVSNFAAGGGEHEEDLFHMSHTPALVYATLAWVTAIATFQTGVASDDYAYLLNKSISAIGEDLGALSEGKQLSDGTIAAVACLTNMENINGNKSSAQMHMNGLKALIDSRGGLEQSKVNVFARRLVLWADVLCATRWQTRPAFNLEETPDILALPDLQNYRPASSLAPSFEIRDPNYISMVKSTGNAELIPVQYELYHLAHFLDNVPARDAGLLDRSSFSDRVYAVEHRILRLLERNEGKLPRDSILIPLMHSFLLWLYTNIRLTPIKGQIRLTLIARLRTYIESSDMLALNRTNPHELRWMLFLGGASSENGSTQRAWFVNTMVECGCRREWSKWEHIAMGLKGFEKAFLGACAEYWAEVEATKGEKGHKAGKHGPYCIGDDEYFVKDYEED